VREVVQKINNQIPLSVFPWPQKMAEVPAKKEMEHFSPEDNGKHQQNYSCQADSEKEWQRYKLTY
jgi:hypothetical protein